MAKTDSIIIGKLDKWIRGEKIFSRKIFDSYDKIKIEREHL